MTDIPQAYLDEAVRRLNEAVGWNTFMPGSISAQVLARTLQELGWEPPVPPELLRAREIALQVIQLTAATAYDVKKGIWDKHSAVQAAIIALREGMGK